MLKLRLFWVAGLALTLAQVSAAESELGIALGNHRVHPTRILARYSDPAAMSQAESTALLSSLGLQIARDYHLVPGLVSLDEAQSPLRTMAVVVVDPNRQRDLLVQRITALRNSGLFAYAEPNYVYNLLLEPNDEAYITGDLWGLKNSGGNGGAVGADISAPEAWDITTGSTNVIVAVIDSGVRYSHVDLESQMWRNPGEIPANGVDDDGNGVVDDVFGVDAFDPDNITGEPMDLDGHGTHVAGTIGAAANNGQPHVGVAWNVQIMACKFLGAQGGITEGAMAALEYAVDNGAMILNNSWGGGAYSTALFDTITAARNKGVLFVAAAGNDASNNDEVENWPSNYPVDNIIAVAAVDRADQLADFSNYGAQMVHVGAPGVDIFSSVSFSDTAYAYYDGTSMASPHVAGIAALIRAQYPGISLFELRERILQTVVPIPSLDGRTTTGGRVNAFKALTAVGDGELEIMVTPPSESVVLSGTTQQVYVAVSDLFAITNATVEGLFVQGMNRPLAFKNDGTAPDVTAGDNIYSGEFFVPLAVPELRLQITASAPDKTSIQETVRWYVAEPPTNDNFADALKIPGEGAVVYSNNKFATIEIPNEPAHAGVPTVAATLWWTWSPSFDNRALVDTAGSEFDTVVAVYTNKPLSNVREIASANDAGGRSQGYLQFDAVRGVTYYLVVGGTSTNEVGSIRLRVDPNAAPDVLAPLVSFTHPNEGLVVSTNWLELEGVADDPTPGSGVSQVFVKLATDPIGKVASGTTNWTSKLLLRPGANTIMAQATDFARNRSDFTEVHVTYVPPTVENDHFVNAMVLEGTGGVVPASNQTATREYLEPFHGDNLGGRSLWYRFTSEEAGVLTLTTTNLGFDSLLGVYTGSPVSALTTIAGNDDAVPGSRYSKVSVGIQAGVAYSIAVDGYNGSSGDGELAYEFVAGELFSLTVGAGPNGRVSSVSGDYASGSSVTVQAYPDQGYAFYAWEGTTNSTQNPLVVVMDADQTITASFRRASISDDFESGRFSSDLNYILSPTGSSASWSVQSGSSAAGGRYSAKSGRIGGDRKSILALTEPMVAGVGSFAFRVSTEQNFDYLEFRINGQLKAKWSGANDWTTHHFVVNAGTNTLEWIYTKDVFGDELEDAVFIDDLNVPVNRVPAEGVVSMSIDQNNLGSVLMTVEGAPNAKYRIEASDDVVDWVTVTSVQTDAAGRAKFTESRDTGLRTRFYRAIGIAP